MIFQSSNASLQVLSDIFPTHTKSCTSPNCIFSSFVWHYLKEAYCNLFYLCCWTSPPPVLWHKGSQAGSISAAHATYRQQAGIPHYISPAVQLLPKGARCPPRAILKLPCSCLGSPWAVTLLPRIALFSLHNTLFLPTVGCGLLAASHSVSNACCPNTAWSRGSKTLQLCLTQSISEIDTH